MAALTTFINGMLDDAFTGIVTMKLFQTGTPSSGGTEVSGGGYTPQTLSLSLAAAKKKSTSTSIVFTNLPAQTIVAYGLYIDGVLSDEGELSSPFTADVTSNELKINYTFDASGL